MLVSITCVGEYYMCWLVLHVLVNITYVLVNIPCVGEYNMCW